MESLLALVSNDLPRSVITATVFVALIFLFTSWASRSPISACPGPRLASWTRLYSVAAVLTGREHEMLLNAHKKYGPLVRWQPNLLLVNDPTMLPKIYHLRANKTPHYNHSTSDVKGMVEENDWQKHRAKRHRMDPAFSPKSVRDDENLVDGFIAQWIAELQNRFATTGKTFDFSDWGNYLALDIVTKRFFGQEMGFIKHEDKNGMLADTRANGPAIHALARLPRLKMFLLRSFGKFLVPTAGDGSGLGNVLQLRDVLYDERLAKADETSPIGLDVLGASDTTGHGLRCLLRNLLQNPVALSRLRQEIDSQAYHNGEINTQKMPYLSACIRESLRHDPPIVSFLPRWVDDPAGVELCGRVVPQGVEVACSPYVLSRNQELYGADVDVFRPERFLEGGSEWAARAARYDFVFGYGPRHCIGQNLSHFITCKAIVKLLQTYDVDLIAPGSGKAFLNWNYSGLNIRLRARKT